MDPAEFIAAREQLGLSRSALAKRLGIERRTIWNWEHGTVPIKPIAILALCWLLHEHEADLAV